MASDYQNHYAAGVPSPAFRDLGERRITPDEYAQRTRREVEELLRESPAPSRRPPKAPKTEEGERS